MTTLAKNIDWDRVARYYDACVRVDFDVPFFLEQARLSGSPILELMCGTGRITLPLAEAGFAVTALDSSRGLLGRLQKKRPQPPGSIRIIECDVRFFSLGETFPLVMIGFHALAEVLGREDRLLTMQAVRAHTAPGGRAVITLHNPTLRRASAHGEWREMGRFPLEPGVLLEVASRWDVDATMERVHGVQRYREWDAKRPDQPCLCECVLPITFDLVLETEMRELASLVGFKVMDVYGDYQKRLFAISGG